MHKSTMLGELEVILDFANVRMTLALRMEDC
jgi:hypothetical protein